MARKPRVAVEKILAWRNPTPIAPRWDLEVVREDGTRERVVGVSDDVVRRLVGAAEAAGAHARRGRT